MSMLDRLPWTHRPQSEVVTYLRSGAFRRRRLARRGLIAYLLLTAVGVAAFVGLLVASHYLPGIATPLRIAALTVFFGFGVLRAVLFRRR
jgi:hypothetical protein